MRPEEEKEIIKKVIGGDKNAFEVLVLANQKNVYNIALKITRHPEDALDISQEAFIKAYQKLADFRYDARFSVWLYKLTYNLCIDALRKKSKQQTTSLNYEGGDWDAKTIEIPDIRELPEDGALRKETRENIAAGINKLPQKLREIIVMREITGMSYEDISTTLRISRGTVKSRLSRARLKLTEILRELGTFPEEYRLNLREEVE